MGMNKSTLFPEDKLDDICENLSERTASVRCIELHIHVAEFISPNSLTARILPACEWQNRQRRLRDRVD